MENSSKQGALGLPNFAVKADSLLLKQDVDPVDCAAEKSFHLLGFWLGGFQRDTGFDENLDIMPLLTGGQEEVKPVCADMLEEPRLDEKLLNDKVSPIPYHH